MGLSGKQVRRKVGSRSVTKISVTDSSVATLAAQENKRLGLMLFNKGTGIVFVKYGTGAGPASYTVRLSDKSYWEMPEPIDNVVITAKCKSGGSADVMVTELKR